MSRSAVPCRTRSPPFVSGVPVFEAGAALYPNGERHLRELADLARIYPPELLEQTLVVAERCHFSLDELRYEYPEELVPTR